MTDHTKLPWRVEQGTDLIWGACNPDDQSTYGMGYSIVQGKSGAWGDRKPDMNEREANAAFIVKAVNNHDQLTADLAEAVRLLDALLGLEKGSGQAAFDFIERINGHVEAGKEP